MRGARLPEGFDNVDSECFAILQAIRATYDTARTEGTDPEKERVLIFCDCAGVVSQVEAAYRTVTQGGGLQVLAKVCGIGGLMRLP